jgi:hypothetical protein
MDAIWVSLAVTAGIIALAGVPLRCWQIYAGRFRSQIPRHLLAQATFSLFAMLILAPNVAGWFYVVYVAYRDLNCSGACDQPGVASAIAAGMLGCAYALLEGFLLTARRRPKPVPGDERQVTGH